MVAAGLGAGAQRQEGGPADTSGPRAKLGLRACIKFGVCRSPARRVVGVLVRTKYCAIFRTVFLLCDVVRSVLLFDTKSYFPQFQNICPVWTKSGETPVCRSLFPSRFFLLVPSLPRAASKTAVFFTPHYKSVFHPSRPRPFDHPNFGAPVKRLPICC